MNQLFHQDSINNQNKNGQLTSKEIEQQPEIWRKTWQKIAVEEDVITAFLKPLRSLEGLNIVLTGAGSSAFIGDSSSATWQKYFSTLARAIPTTDLVTHFKEYILVEKPLLLISFARSGNSPESTAVIKIANEMCSSVYHLIITCNAEGELASMEKNENTLVFLLPPEANDRGLAMTSSFTGMLLSAKLIPALLAKSANSFQTSVERLCKYGEIIIRDLSKQLFKVAQEDFERIIFLGSGAKWGIAKEGHLKVQELTNGKVIGKYDSFLGFRHGPKAIINKDTLIVYLFSNRTDVYEYERDLIKQINGHNIGLTTLAISETGSDIPATDYAITLSDSVQLKDDLWAIACTLPAQIIGFYKSLGLHYNPDNPSPAGTIARVVEGVTIYPHEIELVKE